MWSVPWCLAEESVTWVFQGLVCVWNKTKQFGAWHLCGIKRSIVGCSLRASKANERHDFHKFLHEILQVVGVL